MRDAAAVDAIRLAAEAHHAIDHVIDHVIEDVIEDSLISSPCRPNSSLK